MRPLKVLVNPIQPDVQPGERHGAKAVEDSIPAVKDVSDAGDCDEKIGHAVDGFINDGQIADAVEVCWGCGLLEAEKVAHIGEDEFVGGVEDRRGLTVTIKEGELAFARLERELGLC